MTRILLATIAVTAVSAVATSAQAGELWDVTAPAAKVTVGQKGTAMVTISSKNGWHLNEEAPLTVKLTPAAGVSVEKPKLTRADAVERTKETARFAVALTVAEAGSRTIEADARFVVCQDTACKPVSEKITLAVVATAAAAPAEAPKAPVKKRRTR
jgi:hypothetical protein